MKETAAKKSSNSRLKGPVGLVLVGMGILSIVLAVLVLRLKWPGSVPFATKPTAIHPLPPVPISASTGHPQQSIESTDTSTLPAVNYDSSMANQAIPADVLTEVTYYAGGGALLGPYCSDETTTPVLVDLSLTEQVLANGEIFVISCGWTVNDSIDIRIIRPDGKEITRSQRAISHKTSFGGETDVGFLSFLFSTGVNDPGGAYRVTFMRQEEIFFRLAFWVNPPNYPLISYSSLFGQNDHVELIGFAPQENIRLLEYSCANDICRFQQWRYVVADDTGRVLVPASNLNYDFAAIGDISGLARSTFPSRGLGIPIRCGMLLSRLSIGNDARVALTNGKEMRIRSDPGLSQKGLHMVPEGTEFTVLDGPVCVENSMWWKAGVNAGLEGWVAEYEQDIYLLEPIQ